MLFVKLKNIGDALIMTPALTAARELFPTARIDVLVREGTQGILKGSLAIDNLYTSAAPESNKRDPFQLFKDLALIGKLRKEKYDWAFELSDNNRGRTFAYLSGAKNRAAHIAYDFPALLRPFFNHRSGLEYGKVHRCEKDVELLRTFCGYKGETPALQFDRSFADWTWVQSNLSAAPIVVHAVTRWKRKMWPVENWKKLCAKLCEEAPIVLTSGTSPEEIALTRQIAEVNPQKIRVTSGGLDWPQMAGLLYSARLLVSVDTATMHLGAACQTPTVALFGPTFTQQWSPWQVPHEIIVPPLPANGNPQERRLDAVTVEEVLESCKRLLSKDARV